ncbi:MAG TPA: PAS domain-containing sensor histidine kinase [Rhodospirillaceae bacterium]|nr:PAS domain-containing sensor histidine kinase [Rhodospirillaceae bacterium]
MVPNRQHWNAALRRWSLRVGLARKLAVALTIAVIASGAATFAAMTSSGPLGGPNPGTVFAFLTLDLVLLLLLAALVARQLAHVWAERRTGAAGARLHVRLVVMFSVVAVTPAILVAVFSALVINYGVEQWFNQRVSTALNESLAVAKAYMEEHQQIIGGDALAMANDINRGGSALLRSQAWLSQMVGTQAAVRALTEAVVFTTGGQILARSGMAFSMELSIDRIPQWAFDRAEAGEVAVLTNSGDQRVRALVKLESGFADTYLFVGRYVDPKVLDHMNRTSQGVEEYQRLEGTRSGLVITFLAIYAVVALLLLLSAIWVGLSLATELATPIVHLIDAAEKVRGGDLSARVADDGEADELGSLSRAFNRMTSQLSTQRQDLVQANRELDERRRFTETVLAGVSAGVIGLDRNGVIELPNRSAAEYLSTAQAEMIGVPLIHLVPEMAPLFDSVQRRPERMVQDQINLRRLDKSRILMVRIVAEQDENEEGGYVVTIDDISELLSAQRKAAWADVARRIAHEIKNPLTPIQLSAERLKRKYLKQIDTDRQIFVDCTDTIIRQVGDIGRMVDEFSAFARMPAPVIKLVDILELLRQALFLAQTAHPEISFACQTQENAIEFDCDARQIGQALTNLLKNASEAIEGREGSDLPPGNVVVTVTRMDQDLTIAITDNGKGLPLAIRDQLTEPYVTTRAKGTGLGLAIVKKIMEDHAGELILEDLDGGGVCASLVFKNRADLSNLDEQQGSI